MKTQGIMPITPPQRGVLMCTDTGWIIASVEEGELPNTEFVAKITSKTMSAKIESVLVPFKSSITFVPGSSATMEDYEGEAVVYTANLTSEVTHWAPWSEYMEHFN